MPESYFEEKELLRTKGKGNKLQVLVRWAGVGAADSVGAGSAPVGRPTAAGKGAGEREAAGA
eukprot:6515122-Prymnesium_polylepis.1